MNLKEMADNAINNETKVDESNEEVMEAIEEVESSEEPVIVVGDYVPSTPANKVDIPNAPARPVPVAPSIQLNETIIPTDMLSNYDKLTPENKIKYSNYKASLISNGMDENTANKMMNKRINEDFNFEDQIEEVQYKDEDSEIEESGEIKDTDIAVIEIDKTTASVDDLKLTEDEHAKLEKVKAIKLIVVEDEELRSIKIDKVKSEHKADYIKSIEGSLSNYSIPLPTLGDFVGFKGAQIIQLASAVTYEDEKVDESINKKASLIYDKLFSGKVIKKYSDNGNIGLTYDGFANIFPFADLDLSLYAILVASSMEETEAEIPCEKCEQKYEYKYNLKKILDLDDIPDHFKERIDFILGNKSDVDALKKLSEDMAKVLRFKSPFTQNIYDVSYPTVARAANLFAKIDQTDSVMLYNATLAMYLNKMYVYNRNTDSYIEIEENELDTMIDAVSDVPDEDYKLLMNQIQEKFIYTPKFILKTKCPHCRHEMTLDLNVDGLVFLKAQDSLKEIR